MEVKNESHESSSAVSQQPQAESIVTSAATPTTPPAAAEGPAEGAAACNINSESHSNGSAATAAAAAAAAASEENGRGAMEQGRMLPPSLKRPREVQDWLLHPPDGSEPIDLRQEAEAIYSAFELSLCRDVVFELHRELHTGVLTKERLWAEHHNPPPKSVAGGDVYGRIPPREPSTSITCPSCNRAVGVARYAPHLDKCALGSSRGRASRSARSSPQQEPSKYADSSSPSSKQSSSRQSSSSKPSPKVSSASKPSAKLLPSPKPKPPKLAPSPKPPKAAVSARPNANSRPASKPPSSSTPSSSRVPLASRPAPPPPPPAVHPALVDTGREPLHILVKLVDGAPVQTYHRVVLSTPRVEKPQPQQPRSPSTRSLGSDNRPGGPPRVPSHHSSSMHRAIGASSSTSGSSSGNNSGGSGGGGGGVVGAASTISTSSARSSFSFSSLPSRGGGISASSSSTATAVAGGASRNSRQKQYGGAGGSRPSSPSGGFYDSRLVDSRGGSLSGTGRNSPPVAGGEPNPWKRQAFSSQGNSGQSSRALVGGYASINNSGGSSAASSPPSPPPTARVRVPPPLFVSAPRSPPHASPGVGAQGQDLDRRCLERVVEPADRQILSWHD